MSKAGAVEARGVAMPMIDDQAEAVDDDLPRAIPPQAQNPPPKNVQEAYIRMKKTRNAGELCALVTIFCGLVCAGICMTIFLVAVSLIHIYLLVVGALHINDCQVERLIPIYLIVAGVFAILRAVLNWYYAWCHPKIRKEGTLEEVPKPSPFSNIINLFLLVWMVCGAVWVFRVKDIVTFDDVNSLHYCDKLTYYTAYIYIIVSLVVMAISLIIACCLCSCVVCTLLVGGAASEASGTATKRGDGGV